MNDDCLLKIFMCESLLNPFDLCSLAETCTRFQEIILRIIPKTLRVSMSDSVICDIEFRTFSRTRATEVERIFKNFGPLLSSIEISIDHHEIEVCKLTSTNKDYFLIHLLTKHCDDDNLKILRIHFIKIPHVFTVKCRPIFNRLEKLYLVRVGLEHGATLFYELNSLVELRLHHVHHCGSILKCIFPKLERFDYKKERIVLSAIDRGPREQTSKTLYTFISRHKTLKKFRLHVGFAHGARRSILTGIGYNCKELKELCLRTESMTSSSLQPLQQALKSLTILSLSRVTFEDFKLFSALRGLRNLSLDNCHLPNSSDQFAYLTQLTKLVFSWYRTPRALDVVGIVGRLTNLDELMISAFYDTLLLDKETFTKIAAIVKERPQELTLKCGFNFDVGKFEEDRKIILLPAPAPDYVDDWLMFL